MSCLKLLAQNYNYCINVDDCKTTLGFLNGNTRLPTLPEEIKLLMLKTITTPKTLPKNLPPISTRQDAGLYWKPLRIA